MIHVRLDPDRGFVAARENPLDYCFVAVHHEDVAKLVNCKPIRLCEHSRPERCVPITIWQHPGGGVKVCNTWTVDRMGSDGAIEYVNDTEPGSSGAPIFDNVGTLIGIHAYGRDSCNGGCLLD